MFRPLRLALSAAALAAVAHSAAAFDMSAMTDAERDAFRAEVRAYLLDNPEVLMEAIGVLEERQAAAQEGNDAAMIAALSEQLFEDPTSWVGGNPEGDVTVVEFLDYRCSYCRRAHPDVAELIASDGNIRLIVKEFPILGEQSVLGSRFALAVRDLAGDDAYHKMADTLMTMKGDIATGKLKALAADLGLDWSEVDARMNSEEITRIIDSNRALAQTLQINGTPSFIFGDRMVRGYVPLETMQDLIADLREG